MTKKDRSVLCPSCHEFDKNFENSVIRLDYLTVCECDWEMPQNEELHGKIEDGCKTRTATECEKENFE